MRRTTPPAAQPDPAESLHPLRRADAITERLQEALEDYPTEGDSHILIWGPSGIGKSQIVKRFAKLQNLRTIRGRPRPTSRCWS
ncbi:TniB family NTP-binding protein [Halopseudomonas pachastrellae]|nr:TniB family NTP-binding protein [Halopseudomonas pachastrellae]